MNCKLCLEEGITNHYVVNKTYQLCDKHNKERLGVKSKRHKLSQISEKGKEQLKAKQLIYQVIDGEREMVCSGCGNANALSHSHLIPVSHNKTLEVEKDNIKFHCLFRQDDSEGCHSRWESNDFKKMKTMLDFEENMAYIKKTDLKYYNFILSKNV